MIIANPKARRVMNSAIVNVIFIMFIPLFLGAIACGTIEGWILRKFFKKKVDEGDDTESGMCNVCCEEGDA